MSPIVNPNRLVSALVGTGLSSTLCEYLSQRLLDELSLVDAVFDERSEAIEVLAARTTASTGEILGKALRGIEMLCTLSGLRPAFADSFEVEHACLCADEILPKPDACIPCTVGEVAKH